MLRKFMVKSGFRRLVLPLLVLLTSLGISYFVYRLMFTQQNELNRADFESNATRQVAVMKELVYRDIDLLASAMGFFRVRPQGTQSELAKFSMEMLKRNSSLVALEWLPMVDRAGLEARLEILRETDPELEAYTRSSDEFVAIDLSQETFFPVVGVVPTSPENRRTLGFVPQDDRFGRVVAHALKSSQPLVSDKVGLIQDEGLNRKDGLLVYQPVHTLDSGRLLGIVIGVFRISDYIRLTLEQLKTREDLAFLIQDVGYADEDKELFRSDEWPEGEAFKMSRSISFSNRSWDVSVVAPGSMPENDRRLLALLLVCGGLISLAIGALVLDITNKKAVFQHLLTVRTKELHHLARHDALTSLLNRGEFNVVLERACGSKGPVTLVYIDTDLFKTINDTWGHETGDKALIHLARVMGEQCRKGDTLARIGGDEFALISREAERKSVSALCGRIVDQVAGQPLYVGSQEIRLSVSLGAVSAGEGAPADRLREQADQAMYHSKNAGRGCFSLYEDLKQPENPPT